MATNEPNTIEFKQSWQDNYLGTFAAFADTDGGTMRIGIDDSGRFAGVSGLKKLLSGRTVSARRKVRCAQAD